MNNPAQTNPNAAVAGGGTGLGVVLIWALGQFGVDMPNEVAVALVGALTTVALWLGKRRG